MADFNATIAPAKADEASVSEQVLARPLGGFDFSLHTRNSMLEGAGKRPPKALKTGTTICGVVYDGGIVLGADTRATEGSTVADKNCEKIHYLAPNIYCCGADGLSVPRGDINDDAEAPLIPVSLVVAARNGFCPAAAPLRRHQGHISAALVLGGVDCTGPHLYTVYPHGSTDKLPFVSMGSGSLAAMAMLEMGYKDSLTEAEAKALVTRAIRAGIFNDLGSGSNVDLTVIRASGETEILRGYEKPNVVDDVRAKALRPSNLAVPKGATAVLKETFQKFIQVTDVTIPGAAGSAAS